MKKKWVRAQSLVLIAILFVLALPKFSIPTYAYSGGSGTVSDPYLVATPQDLINVGNYTNKHYLQICDISMEGYSYTPISTFTGTYDGNGYAIQNLYIKSYSSKVGLFAINYGTIQNLHLRDCEIITTTLTDVVFCGGIAGRNYQGGEVINCSVSGTVTGKSHGYNTEVYVGGLVGLNQGLIQNCCNFAQVNGTSTSAALDAYAGGITGNNNTTSVIKNCSNEGLIRATNGRNCLAGGIAGINFGIVTGVMNSAEIYAESSIACDGYNSDAYAAGAVAYNRNYVSYAENSGFIRALSSVGSAEAGGIVAYNGDAPYEPGPYVVEKSINRGDVTASSTGGESRAGGIAATSYMNSYVRYCCNMGNVSATENKQYNLAMAGGLVASLMYATMIESCNHGNVTVSATQYDTQVCGLATTTEAVIKNCYNTGDVFVNSTPVRYSNGQGAMLFIDSDTTCLNCYSTGTISKSHSQNECQGLYGTTGGTNRNTVQNCFTTESIGTPAASLISIEQAKQQATFTDYDFNGTWAIDPAINDGLPYLRNIPDEDDTEWFVDPAELIAVNGVKLSESRISPKLGQTIKLVATISPSNAKNQSVKWESSNTDVATVDEFGFVTVNGFGNTTIRVTTDDGGFIASCTVSVPAYVPSFSGGTGTPSNPYLISTVQDVANMHYNPTAHYRLTNSISLAGVSVIPIGTAGNPFSGTFNGDGHCLSDLTLTADGDRTYLALFGYTTGSITDLYVKNFTVRGTSVTNNIYCAALIAYAESGKVENCHVIATVNATAPGERGASYAGGLVAASGVATIKDCSFSGQVTSNVIEIDSNAYSGGICAYGKAVLENCQNYGTIRSEGGASCDVFAGGIVGFADGNILQCYNSGSIEGINSRGSYVGGITGQNQGNVYNSTNCGAIYASTTFKDFNDDVRSYAGGISGSNFGTVQYGYNEGGVHSYSTSAHAYAGGVVGYCQSEAYIYYSKNKGDIKAGSTGGESRAGGIASTCYTDGAVKYCCNEGNVSIYDNPYYWGGYAGGVLAVLQYGTLSECCNHGTVTIDSTAYTPFGNGIAAFSEATLNNCYSDGNVHSAFTRHETYNNGMICGIGTGHDTPVETCYFAGELTSDYSYTEKYGLIHTNGQGGNTVTDCYAFALYGSAGEGSTMSREDSVLQSTYQNYDFTSVWAIDPEINEGRPYLRRVPTDADANWYSGVTEQPAFPEEHYASSWIVASYQSCTEDGYRYMICTECGETFNEEITLAYGHEWSGWYFTKYPTCTATGIENRECYSCYAIESRSAAAYGHDYALSVTPPTCTEQGYTTYTCDCGDSYVSDFVDATGHAYKNGTCTGCGEEDTDGLSLDGLNVLCLGDSITMGQGLTTATRWTNVLASKYGWTLTNKSQGGISLSSYYYTSNGQTDVSIAKKAEVLKTMTTKPDVIIVWGGHNDTSYRASPLGTWDDETTDSFKGALKYIAELADEYAPNATLFVLTPFLLNETPTTLKVPANTSDNNWMFVDAIYDGAEKYGWIPINMDLCGITPFTKTGFLLDNIHPNEAGTEKIVEYLSEELASYGQSSRNETIIFNQSSVSVKIGESTTLKAVLSPRSGTGTVTFTWSSSDSSVATVDEKGKITAVAPGTAIVTATAANGIYAGISVCVEREHAHEYETTVTLPTCTEQGYTTYTCTACGESYVDDFTEAMGHSYKDGVCTVCGVAISSWEIGTIASANGLDQRGDSRMRTMGYLKLTDCIGVGIGQGYTMTNFVYDENYNYLGTSSWIGNGMPFTTAELKEKYPTGVYFRVVFRALNQRTLSEAAVEESGVKFYFLGEQIPEPDLGFAYKDVASIGGWQDGAVFNGKLFALGAAGKGAVYDVQTGATLGNFTLDRGDVLKPHANSVCFGSTYYRAGDQYPLLYVNIYNNYANAEDRMEGTCCVYRLTESEGNYTTELVQVIRIGFTENLTLWKSEENNGDIRPYGNFVVDTDQNKLYAYVMRDANLTIRFFSFDIPALDQGAYVDAYGCNLVTLVPDDIETQFDIGVYHYLQGCTYHSGMILMALDFGGDAPLCIVDLKTQRVIQTYYLGYAGLRSEPEVLCADPDTGVLYYAAADGMLRVLTLKDVHLHTYTSVTTPPTCTEQGYTTYTCTACGESYVDDDTPALGHNMNEWSVTAQPTCTANGTQRRDCSRCDYFETEVITASGHAYNAVVTAPTCTEQGYTTYTCTACGESYVDDFTEAIGHSMGAWSVTAQPTCTTNGTQRRDCSRCDYFETEVITASGHAYNAVVTAPTCTEQGYTTYTCTACGDSYVDDFTEATGHSLGAWSVTAQPTCTANGAQRRDCSRCDYFETEIITANGHAYNAVVTAPTCTEQGYTTYTCTACGDSYVDDFTEATGHSMGTWSVTAQPTCTANGTQRRDCSRCDHFETEVITASGHAYNAVVTAPTCREKGYTTHECTRCNEGKYVDSYVDALGHSFTNYVSNNDATYSEDGTKTAKCDRCYEKNTVTDEGSALGMAQKFRDEMAELNQNADTETTYVELYALLQTYSSLSVEEKTEVAKEFATLQQMVNAYNAKAQTANHELAEATKNAFAPIAVTSFTFLAALWFLLRKKFLI